MQIDQNLSTLIQNARLDIVSYNIAQKINSMGQRNRILNCYAVSYIKEGTCRLRIHNRDYYTSAGDVVLIPPNVIHDHIKDTHETTNFMWWHFNFKIADTIDLLSMFEFPVCFRLPDPRNLEEVFSRYIQCTKQSGSIFDIIMKEAKALEMLAIILESAISFNQNNYSRSYNNTFTQILMDLVKNSEKKCNLKELADTYHLHPTYISNNFKKIFGVSPIELQKENRLGKAKKLLQFENYSVMEVAHMVGYEDGDDFTRFFKNRVGISPLKFKSRHVNSNGSESYESILNTLNSLQQL